jgi:hypothetical protein
MLARIGDAELPKGRQGIERKIPVSALPRLLLTAELAERLSIPFRAAFRLATTLANGEQPAGPFVRLEADFASLRAEIDRQLETAIESVVRRPRGRPAKSAQ